MRFSHKYQGRPPLKKLLRRTQRHLRTARFLLRHTHCSTSSFPFPAFLPPRFARGQNSWSARLFASLPAIIVVTKRSSADELMMGAAEHPLGLVVGENLLLILRDWAAEDISLEVVLVGVWVLRRMVPAAVVIRGFFKGQSCAWWPTILQVKQAAYLGNSCYSLDINSGYLPRAFELSD